VEHVAKLLNDMVETGVLTNYAVFGAVAQMRYTEAVTTLDADVLVAVPEPGAWDNAFINFDHTGWFPAPNYVVMKLWWDNFAPKFLPVTGDAQGCNLVATRSEDGGTLVIKAVNPKDQATTVEVDLKGGFAPKTAAMQVVAPGSLRARNTLAEPAAVRPEAGAAQLNGKRARFQLPAYSTAVVKLN